jgi:hypothetical protein
MRGLNAGTRRLKVLEYDYIPILSQEHSYNNAVVSMDMKDIFGEWILLVLLHIVCTHVVVSYMLSLFVESVHFVCADVFKLYEQCG